MAGSYIKCPGCGQDVWYLNLFPSVVVASVLDAHELSLITSDAGQAVSVRCPNTATKRGKPSSGELPAVQPTRLDLGL